MAKGHIPRPESFKVGNGIVSFEDQIPIIPRSEWGDRIRQLEKDEATLRHITEYHKIPCKDQKQVNYCHAASPAHAIEVLNASMGQPFVEMSIGGIGGPVTNYRNDGAWIGDDLQHIVKYGCPSTEFVPMLAIRKSEWKPGAEENALSHRVKEWWDLGDVRNDGIPKSVMFDRIATMLLMRLPVCFAYWWMGHAMTAFNLTITKNKKFGLLIRNSWTAQWGDNGFAEYEEGTKGTPDEAYVPRVVLPSTT